MARRIPQKTIQVRILQTKWERRLPYINATITSGPILLALSASLWGNAVQEWNRRTKQTESLAIVKALEAYRAEQISLDGESMDETVRTTLTFRKAKSWTWCPADERAQKRREGWIYALTKDGRRIFVYANAKSPSGSNMHYLMMKI